ncbi:hypothetical protein [Telluribacter sp.]|jgi:hypothetical protein|uniref:hypothetical protein n=1 Tax=Telluribacter sp. TaxID=1978767 RepID=UPI002E15DD32|nr:hypothetical protein [Telluribacter sp.]
MESQDDNENIEGGAQSPGGPKGPAKHKDDAAKSSARLDQEAVEEFEEHNMSKHRGYNEPPEDVPVKKKETRR